MKTKVSFLGFTEPNLSVLAPALAALPSSWDSVFVPGFDFEVYRKGTYFAKAERIEGDSLYSAWFERHREFGLAARLRELEREVRNHLADRQPDIVVIPEETDYARGALLSSVLKEFPEIKRAVFFPLYYHLFRDYPLSDRPRADYYFTATETLASDLERTGVARKRISVLGLPAIPLKNPKTPRRLVYLMQGIACERRVMKDVETIALEEGWDFVAKPHPKFVSQAEPLEALLTGGTVVVGQSSTGFFGALAAQVPVLVAHYQMGPFPLRLDESNKGVRIFTDGASLKRALSYEFASGPYLQTVAPDRYAELFWEKLRRVTTGA